MIKEESVINLMVKWGNFKANCKSNFTKTDMAKKNKELQDKYKNKRCFIIGNAKSIRKQNLGLLANEMVFVTNEFFKYEKYQDARPDYYVIVDPAYFNENTGEQLLYKMDKVQKYEHKPAFVVPDSARKIISERYKWDEWADVYYLHAGLRFASDYSKIWDITKPVPFPQSVIQVAMLLATFMGFREIYLLGVEETGIYDVLNAYLDRIPTNYAYEEKNESKNYINVIKSRPIEEWLRGCAIIFQHYREVYDYCKRRGVEVFNCTPETLVTSIPHKNLESVLKCDKIKR